MENPGNRRIKILFDLPAVVGFLSYAIRIVTWTAGVRQVEECREEAWRVLDLTRNHERTNEEKRRSQGRSYESMRMPTGKLRAQNSRYLDNLTNRRMHNNNKPNKKMFSFFFIKLIKIVFFFIEKYFHEKFITKIRKKKYFSS